MAISQTTPKHEHQTIAWPSAIVQNEIDYVEAHRIEESHAVHRVGHPRDDAAQSAVRRRQPLAGVSRLPGAGGDQGGGVRGDQRRRQPVRGHVGRAAAARGGRARVHPPLRPADRRRRAGHRLLRLDRSDDGDDDGDHRSGRRGRHLRAVLRELRPRRDPVGRDAALRHAARAATGRFDPDELAAAFNDKTKAIIINTPNNPTGKVFTRDELETIADALPQVGRDRDLRRDLRAHHLRRPPAHPDRDASRAWPTARSRSTACRRPTA